MSNWPDKDNPGVPLNPKVTGEHYIGDSVALWYADLRKWAIIRGSRLQPPELLAGQCWAKYIGPCPTSAEADALRTENARLRESLQWFLDNDETNEGDVPMPEYGDRTWNEINEYWIDGLNRARAALNPDGQKARRAKALAELAEMDADLLDLDPKVKP